MQNLNVLAARVNWYHGWGNAPQLEILFDEEQPQMMYQKKNGVYFAEYKGLVSFLSYSGPGYGFSGREFKLLMQDGTTETLIGPWSGNSLVAELAGFPSCIEVSYTHNAENFKKGYTLTNQAITLSFAKEIISKIHLPEGHLEIKRSSLGFNTLVRVNDAGEEIGKPEMPKWRSFS